MQPLLLSLLLLSIFPMNTQSSIPQSLGIDIGTSFLRIVIHNPTAMVPFEMFTNELDNRKTPAVLGFLKNGDREMGEAMLTYGVRMPNLVFVEVKRLVGSTVDSVNFELYKKWFPHYHFDTDPERNTPLFPSSKGVPGGSPEQLLSQMLSIGRKQATKYAHQKYPSLKNIDECVITVPPFFSEDQATLLKQSAELGGLKVIGVLDDLTAVAVDYATMQLTRTGVKTQTAIFYGSGSFGTSATLVQFDETPDTVTLTVLAKGVDETVGGMDLDELLVDLVVSRFESPTDATVGLLRESPVALAKVRWAVRQMKEECLSVSSICDLNLENLISGKNLDVKISRADFEALAKPIFEKLMRPISDVLSQNKGQITAIEMFGGTARIPKLQQLIHEKFGIPVGQHINSDESAVLGAGAYAASLKDKLGFKIVVKELLRPQVPTAAKPLTPEQYARSARFLAELELKEEKRLESLEAKSTLESFVSENRIWLDEIPNLDEVDDLRAKLSAEQEWIDDNYEILPVETYKQHLMEIEGHVASLRALLKKSRSRKNDL